MATESPPRGALFRALRAANVDPELAFQAVEESRNAAEENVIAAISAQLAELRTELKTALRVGFAKVNGRIDALSGQVNSRTKHPRRQGRPRH